MSSQRFRLALVALAVMMTPGLLLAVDSGGKLSTKLRPIEEVPALSSLVGGVFNATISDDNTHISYTFSYKLVTPTQAHIHFAQAGVNGGIMIFLCSNLGNGPAGTQACPAAPAVISGTIEADDVIGGAAAQGIAVGNFAAALKAMRAGVAYVNLHSPTYPGGEGRGQLVYTPKP